MKVDSSVLEASRVSAETVEAAQRARELSEKTQSALSRVGLIGAIFQAMRPVFEMQDSLRATFSKFASVSADLNSGLRAVAQFHAATEQFRKIPHDFIRAQADAFASIERVHRAANLALIDNARTRFLQSMGAEFAEAQRSRQRMLSQLSDAMRLMQAPRMIDIARLIPQPPQLGDLAKLIPRPPQLGDFASVIPAIDSLTLSLSALEDFEREIAEYDHLADTQNVRDSIFAFCNSDEFLPEREYVAQELAKVEGFDQLSLADQLAELRQIVLSNSSPRLIGYAVMLAANWLSDYWEIQNKSLMLLIALLIFAVDWFTAKQRVSTARQLARDGRLPSDTRLVSHACEVFNSPRHRRRRIAEIQAGMLVEAVEKRLGGCPCVS